MDRLNAREVLYFAAALFLIAVPAGSSSSTQGVSPGENEGEWAEASRGARFRVERIATGDEMVARSLNGAAAYLDLAGCRAPEAPFARPAAAALSTLVQNQVIEVISRHAAATNRDEPARRQVTAFVPAAPGKVIDVCAELIAEGLGLPQSGGLLPPEVEMRYQRLAMEARAARIGIWSDRQAPRFATGAPRSMPLPAQDLRLPASTSGAPPAPATEEANRCAAGSEAPRPGAWSGP